MTNNTTINQNKQAAISPGDLSNLLASWKACHLSDTQVVKALRLYCGVDEWLDPNGMYNYARFSEMARKMNVRSSLAFVEKILQCDGFGFVWDGTIHTPEHLLAFFSPLRCDLDQLLKAGESQQGDGNAALSLGDKECLQASTTTCLMLKHEVDNNYIFNNNINNIYITKKNIYKKNIIDSTVQHDANVQHDVKTDDYDVKAAVSNFLHRLCNNEFEYNAFIAPINQKTELLLPSLHTASVGDKYPVNAATRRFLGHYIANYFLKNGNTFVRTNYDGQKIWLGRILQKSVAATNISRAVDDIRRKLGQDAQLLIRQNHPISPHEYQDPASGIRFYDSTTRDGKTERVEIPPNATPRPSEKARWDKFRKLWKEN